MQISTYNNSFSTIYILKRKKEALSLTLTSLQLELVTILLINGLTDVKQRMVCKGSSIHWVVFGNAKLSVPILWPVEVVSDALWLER